MTKIEIRMTKSEMRNFNHGLTRMNTDRANKGHLGPVSYKTTKYTKYTNVRRTAALRLENFTAESALTGWTNGLGKDKLPTSCGLDRSQKFVVMPVGN